MSEAQGSENESVRATVMIQSPFYCESTNIREEFTVAY